MLIAILAGLVIFVYLIPQLFVSEEAANYYCKHIFPGVAFGLNSLSNFSMVSITENVVVIGVLAGLILIPVFLVRLVKNWMKWGLGRALMTVYRVFKPVLIILLIGVTLFQAMHGVNYRRTPVYAKMELTGEGYEIEQYEIALNWAFLGMVEARSQLGEDYNGVAHMKSSFDEATNHANSLINEAGALYGWDVSNNYIRAKAVMLSHYWSYTGITGVYDAVIGEANLNTDYMDITSFPVTLCHEIIHAKGYAREYDAQTAAIIACTLSPRADFRYAGYYSIFWNLYGEVSKYASTSDFNMYNYLGDSRFEPVRRDILASKMYHTTLEDNWVTKIIDSFSEKVNDTFLKSNGQSEGTQTYHVRPNIYVDYFYSYVMVKTDD